MKLKNYDIGKTLGEGTFGKVKLAKYLPNGQKVAIKIMNIHKLKELEVQKRKLQEDIDRVLAEKQQMVTGKERQSVIGNEDGKLPQTITKLEKTGTQDSTGCENAACDSVSHFQLEVRLMMRFNHPNIIKIYQVIESPQDIYVVMEYASGGDLSTYVSKHGLLSETDSRKFFRQIVSAMDYVHNSKVVHRDLKMENVLLDSQGKVLITDFGLGRGFTHDDKMKTFCGTLSYSAPEIITGKPYYGIKSDIWAMGVILYAMVSGNLPFVGDSIKSLFKKIKHSDYEIPQHFSWELTDLVRFILVTDSEKRLSMSEIRNSRWLNIGYNEKPEVTEPTVTTNESLAKLVSSVTREENCTQYTLANHKEMDNDIQKRKSLTNVQRKRARSFQCSQSFRGDLQSTTIVSENSAQMHSNRPSVTKQKNSFAIDEIETCGPLIEIESREVSVVHRFSTMSVIPVEVDNNEINSWHAIHKPPKCIRTMKFSFKKGLLSNMEPATMFKDLHRVLVEINQTMKFNMRKLEGFYVFQIEIENVSLEIELCKVWLLNLHGLKITKSGSCADFVGTLVSKLGWSIF